MHRCAIIPSACLSVSVSLLPLFPTPVSGFVHYSKNYACIVIVSLLDYKWRNKSVVPVTPNDKSLASARKPKGGAKCNSCHQTVFYTVFSTCNGFRFWFKRISFYVFNALFTLSLCHSGRDCIAASLHSCINMLDLCNIRNLRSCNCILICNKIHLCYTNFVWSLQLCLFNCCTF